MTPQNQLSVEGNFIEHPFAELLAEIAHAQLDGSLRASRDDTKCIFYFKKGKVALAVSNARTSRIFEMLLARKRLTKDDLSRIPNITNDFELADALQTSGVIDKAERVELFLDQIKDILVDVISWSSGKWSFSALARLRDGVIFDVDVRSLLGDYARCLPAEMVISRFRNFSESFAGSALADNLIVLKPEEMTVLKILADRSLTTREVIEASSLQPGSAMQALYALWLTGSLERCDWSPAFPERMIAFMHGAKLELKQEALFKAPVPYKPSAPANSGAAPDLKLPLVQPAEAAKVTLDEYLARVESAETYYDILGIATDADARAVKAAYFMLAKSFHPDHFHQESTELLSRVQHAFTELTRAHETLKDEVLREGYNFKIRKELDEKKKRIEAGIPTETHDERSRQLGQALDNFERGFSLLMENDPGSALPFLARAVHFDPGNARFHAYFGKALSSDDTKRHKAEGEMQTALRLDPQNETYRIMLAEFFIQMKLIKRAEGELNRLLAVFPSNSEARDLLNSLKN